jgi:hypothetical protein
MDYRKDMQGAADIYIRCFKNTYIHTYIHTYTHSCMHTCSLWSYGTFLMDYRKDMQGAEDIYSRCFELDPLEVPPDGYVDDSSAPEKEGPELQN